MLFWIVFLTLVSAALWRETAVRGSDTTEVIFRASTQDLNFVRVGTFNARTIVLGMSPGSVSTVVCTATVTTPIIVAPRGCDNRDESKSVIRANCGHKTVDGLLSTWTYPKDSSMCVQAGQEATCLGPPIMASTGLPDTEQNDLELIQGVMVVSGVGPNCAVPATTRMRVELPTLAISTTAGTAMRCNTILGTAERMFDVDTTESQQRTFVFRNGVFRLALSPQENSRYLVSYTNATAEVFNRTKTRLGIQYRIVVNTLICDLTFLLLNATRPLQLEMVAIPTAANYYKNRVDVYHRTRACSFGVGVRRFEDGRSLVWGVTEGVPYGGFANFVTANGVPIGVDSDPRFTDFDGDCSRFYAKEETFAGFGLNGFDGPQYDRSVPAQYSCYAPFPYPELILDVGTLDARAKQCKMMGGTLSTATSDVCRMDSWRTRCRTGWLYFDERCWYKFTMADQALRVRFGEDSERVCSELNQHATARFVFPLWVSAWLQRHYVYWRDRDVETRVPLEGRRCECYSAALGVRSCDCDDPSFPLCSYHVRNSPVEWDSIDYHPATLMLFKLGQAGAPMDGSEIKCTCLAGSKGARCEQRTCVSPVEVAASVNASLHNPLIAFFKRCYARSRGSCLDYDPSSCSCAVGYGPPSTMDDTHSGTPCMCPSLVGIHAVDSVRINQVTTNSTTGVCGFQERGSCVTSGWNDAECECLTRWSLSRTTEDAFEGAACACPVPHYRAGLDATEAVCNGRGTCCPHHERADGVPGMCPSETNGCVCDDGFAGLACTSRVPSNTQLEQYHVMYPHALMATLVVRLNTRRVYVRGNTVTTHVQVGSEDASWVACELIEREPWERDETWSCPEGTRGWNVMVNTSRPELAHVRITEYAFGPCGLFPNPYMARFFSIPEFRSVSPMRELQPLALYNSVNSACTCAPGYIGPTCSVGVSGFRLGVPQMCGDTTEPPRGGVHAGQCECSELGTDIVFVGDSCACALVKGEMCAGNGTCIEPSFPYGSCSHDMTTLAGDALLTPFSASPAAYAIVTSILYLRIQGVDVTLGVGELFAVMTTNDINVISNVDTELYLDGMWTNVTIINGTAESVLSIRGSINCADPIDRMTAYVRGTTECDQEPIGAHHNTLGVGFGIYHNLTRDVDFTHHVWRHEHYTMLSDLLGGRRCETFDERVWHDLALAQDLSLLRVRLNETEMPVWTVEFILTTARDALVLRDRDGRVCCSLLHHVEAGVLTTVTCNGALGVTGVDDAWSYEEPKFALVSMSCSDSPLLDVDATADQDFLRHIHHAHLAPRRCSQSGECAQFSEDSVCVFDDEERVGWRGGDEPLAELGDEGGCECEWLLSPATFCAHCKEGYGPDSEQDFRDLRSFVPLSDDTEYVRCSLPIDATSSRPTTVCGGRGHIVAATERVWEEEITQFAGRVARTCITLVSDGTRYALVDADSAHVDIHSYVNGTAVASVIRGRVFVEGVETLDWECETRARATHEHIGGFGRRRDAFTSFIA